jgi:hypothetical protein
MESGLTNGDQARNTATGSRKKEPGKMPRRHPPEGSITLTTYPELERFVGAFAKGHMNLLILLGAPGLAKSRTVRRLLGPDTAWIEGNATPFGMYRKLFRHRDQFVVIDDVDSLYADKNGVRLLKCLCQTEEEKAVAWHSAARSLEREGIPREFVTKSRVVIICNDWRTLNRNVAALQDRGHVLLFAPTAAEVHRKTGEWFAEAEVLRWFEEHLHLVREPSMRLYLRAAELKRAGMPWREILPLSPPNPRERLVAELVADENFATQEARAREFHVRGGGCRATYFNHARRLKKKGLSSGCPR